MKYTDGDLLEGDWDAAFHVCNTYKTMGSGVAYFLRKKWPEVYQADLDCELDDDEKLGEYSKAYLPDGRSVYNIYAMWGLGNNGSPLGRNCTYDNLYNALYKMCYGIEDNMIHNLIIQEKYVVGLAYLTGCVRAGGSWVIVEAILKDLEEHFPMIEFEIYIIEGFEPAAQSTQPIV